MAELGKDVQIYAGSSGTSPLIAMAKTCTISKKCGLIEKASATNATSKEFIADREEWEISLGHLVSSSAPIEGLLKVTKMNAFNRIAGALLGLAKALCVLAVVLNFVVMIDHQEALIKPAFKEQSVLYKPVYNTGNMLMGSLKQFVDEHKDEIL